MVIFQWKYTFNSIHTETAELDHNLTISLDGSVSAGLEGESPASPAEPYLDPLF